MISMIKEIVITNLKKMSSIRAIEEGLVTYDFQIKGAQQSLMQICFSPLAHWLSLVLILIAMWSPFRYQFSLVGFLGFENNFVHFLFQSSLQAQSLVFVAFLFLATIVPWEFLVVFLLAMLVSNGDIHIVLAQAGLLGIFFAQVRKQMKWLGKTQGLVKKLIVWLVGLQIFSFASFVAISWILINSVRASGLFDISISSYRVEYLFGLYFLYQFYNLLILSIWGHFYHQNKQDPSVWNLKYSSVFLIPSFNLSTAFQKLFEKKVNELHQNLQNHEKSLAADSNILKVLPQKLVEMQRQEHEFISTAKKMIE